MVYGSVPPACFHIGTVQQGLRDIVLGPADGLVKR